MLAPAQGWSREGLLQGTGWVGSRAGDLYPVFPKKRPGLTTRLLARQRALPRHPNGSPGPTPRLLPPAPSPAPGCLYLQ